MHHEYSGHEYVACKNPCKMNIQDSHKTKSEQIPDYGVFQKIEHGNMNIQDSHKIKY